MTLLTHFPRSLPAGLRRAIPLSRGWLRFFTVILVLLVFWTSLAWWLPPLITPRLSALASEQLGTPVHIGRLSFLPWLLRVEIDDLRIGEQATPLLTLQRAMVDISVSSLWERAPVIEAVQIVEPVLNLSQSTTGQWNIAPLMARFSQPTAGTAKNNPTPPFSVAQAALINARVVLNDERAGVIHHIDDLNVRLPAISTLPGQEYLPIKPQLTARIDGSAVAITAESALFVPGIPTHATIHWQGIDLAQWIHAATPYLPPDLPVTLSQGQLGFKLNINSQQVSPQNPAGMLWIGGSVSLDQLALQAPAFGVRQQLASLRIHGISVDVPQHHLQVGSVTLNAPQTTVDLPIALDHPSSSANPTSSPASASTTDASATASSARKAPTPSEQSAPTPWQWGIDQIQIQQGQLTLLHPAWIEPHRWQDLNATIAQVHDPLSSALPTAYTLSAKTADATPATLSLAGSATLSPTPDIHLNTLDLSAFNLADWLRPWAKHLPVNVTSAILSANAQAQWQPAQWRISHGRMAVDSVHAAPWDRPQENTLACGTLTANGIQAQGGEHHAPVVHIDDLAFQQLAVQATRRTDGQWMALAPQATASSRQKARATPQLKIAQSPQAPPSSAARTPQIDIAKASCTDCAVSLTDQSVRPAAHLGLKQIDFTAERLNSSLLNRPIPFTLKAQSLSRGSFALAGQVQPRPLSVQTQVSLDALELAPVQPYINPFVNIRLQSAALSAKGNLTIAGSTKTPVTHAQFRGNGALTRVFVRDRLTNDPFLRWQSLKLDKMAVNWTPVGVETDLGTVQLNQFFGRIIINADGHLNLSDIVKSEKNEATRSVTEAAAAPQPLPAGEAKTSLATNPNPPPKLRWHRIVVHGGQVDFTDHFIKPNYSAKITDLAGSVSALAWDKPTEAHITLDGRVDGSAPVTITGQANPLARPLSLDINAETKGIELTRLSTYAARYAGYGIEKGSLSATLHYTIKDNELSASNHIVLDQLTFGAPVDSPEATKLPVLLAVSLLQDRNGVIDIELPISGTLTDPEFSMGGIIVKVIVNLLTKAITAPFSLLSSALGGGHENLSVLPFEPGSDTLDKTQTEHLDTLIKALNDRPQLKLEITGFADPAVDSEGLKQAHLLHELRAAKAKATDQPIDSVDISPAETLRWLTVVYKGTKLKNKPKNMIGLTKTVPEEEMKQRLIAAIGITPQALEKLADHRADVVRAYLTAPGKIAPDRVGLTASHIGTKDQQGAGSTARVQFSLH